MGWPLLLLLLVDLGLGCWADQGLPAQDPPLDSERDTLDNIAKDIRLALGLRTRPLDMAKVGTALHYPGLAYALPQGSSLDHVTKY